LSVQAEITELKKRAFKSIQQFMLAACFFGGKQESAHSCCRVKEFLLYSKILISVWNLNRDKRIGNELDNKMLPRCSMQNVEWSFRKMSFLLAF